MSIRIPTYQEAYECMLHRGKFSSAPRLWPGLRGYWDMTLGKAGLRALDFSGNRNHGTLTNGPTWVPGPMGTALDFSGGGDENVTGGAVVSGYPCTFACGFVSDVTNKDQELVAVSNSTNTSWLVIGLASSGRVFISAAETSKYSATSAFSAGRWYTAAVVFASATDRRCYLDGNLVVSDTISKTVSGLNNTTLGGLYYNGGFYSAGVLDGRMSWASIWSRA
ncbi:MAG TPA: LamG-like jellyroll fold domain-containing protein, partial [Phycisphaerae bacterium]|nr:LamG-like jellyroll fold domain-containing protein [Phycisphaerae bacterium]